MNYFEKLTTKVLNSPIFLSKNFISLLIAFFIVFIILYFFSSLIKTNFEDAAAFGANTTTIATTVDGNLIHCIDAQNLHACIDGSKSRNSKVVALWLGNSQLHAINQYSSGDETAPKILFDFLRDKGVDLVTSSFPNANLQEHLFLLNFFKNELPVKILILPVVFDDMRENGIRNSLLNLKMTAELNLKMTAEDLNRNDKNTNKYEELLTEWFEQHSEIWAIRQEIRGRIFSALYKLRNYIFNIKATTKRKIIRGNYYLNLEALEAILMLARRNDIQVLVYVAPIRQDITIPYDSEEYLKFKNDVQIITENYSDITKFYNYEDKVHSDLWGFKDSTGINEKKEIDFMHFTYGGHRILADIILNYFVKKGFVN